MAIVRWNPWTLSQLLDDNGLDYNWDQSIAVDVSEEPDKIIVKAELPGFDESNVRVTVEGSSLTIRAEKTEEEEKEEAKKGRKYYRKEIKSQSAVRTISLPAHVASEKAQAEFKNGILTLTLPKAEEAKPKEISLTKNKKD